MFNIFGKVMIVAGVGLVFASAINAVKKEQEEAVITISNEDGTFAREEHEEISFKEAAKRKVKKFYNKTILWAVDHIQDIQVWTMVLGLFGAFLQVTTQLHDIKRTNQLSEQLNHMEERLNNIEFYSGMAAGLAGQNTLFNSTNFQYLNHNELLTPEMIESGTKMAVDTVSLVRSKL